MSTPAKLGDAVLEPGNVNTSRNEHLQQSAEQGAAKSDAVDSETPQDEFELAVIAKAWPALPEALCRGILAMVEA